MHNIKCVVIGDGAVGKTSMLIAYTSGKFPTDYVPTVFDNYEASLKVDGKDVYLGLWDTAGQEGYDRLRPLSYPQTDVFLMCYAINSPVSYKHIETKWKPEIQHHSPETPFLIIGTKGDLRSDSKFTKGLEAKGKPLKSLEQSAADALELGAAKYLECSAMEQTGLQEVFEEAIRVAFRGRQGRRAPAKPAKGAKDGKGCLLL
jgi:Ras-related C3 botulinum toxin substrate 1